MKMTNDKSPKELWNELTPMQQVKIAWMAMLTLALISKVVLNDEVKPSDSDETETPDEEQ